MKTIYKNSEIADLWLRGEIYSASTSGRNFYFNGESIYSYGPHFMIARKSTNKNGGVAILLTTRGCSHTTSRHIKHVTDAVMCSGAQVIKCAYPNENRHMANFNDWRSCLTKEVSGLSRARKPKIYLQEINNLRDSINSYCDFFGLAIPDFLQSGLAVTCKEDAKNYMKSI